MPFLFFFNKSALRRTPNEEPFSCQLFDMLNTVFKINQLWRFFFHRNSELWHKDCWYENLEQSTRQTQKYVHLGTYTNGKWASTHEMKKKKKFLKKLKFFKAKKWNDKLVLLEGMKKISIKIFFNTFFFGENYYTHYDLFHFFFCTEMFKEFLREAYIPLDSIVSHTMQNKETNK